jgi:hypothetical protein
MNSRWIIIRNSEVERAPKSRPASPLEEEEPRPELPLEKEQPRPTSSLEEEQLQLDKKRAVLHKIIIAKIENYVVMLYQ